MNKEEILHSLFTIAFNREMEAKLRETIGNVISLQTLKYSIENDICDKTIMSKVSQTAPICYKIGDKIFLKGETKGEFDFIGDKLDFEPAIELYDMTEEMRNGDSSTFYVSNVEHFPFATCAEIIKVKNFLDTLK